MRASPIPAPCQTTRMPTALRARLAGATFDTQIAELGLGARAINALDRANILTVEDLLTVPLWRLQRLRGVGNTTRREIATAVKLLREALGNPQHADVPAGMPEAASSTDQRDVGSLSVDLLAQRIMRTSARDDAGSPAYAPGIPGACAFSGHPLAKPGRRGALSRGDAGTDWSTRRQIPTALVEGPGHDEAACRGGRYPARCGWRDGRGRVVRGGAHGAWLCAGRTTPDTARHRGDAGCSRGRAHHGRTTVHGAPRW